jgi:hypothetical protein
MRRVEIPARVYYEEITSLEEFPGRGPDQPGLVRVFVRRTNEIGDFLPGAALSYTIEGEMYNMLVGDGVGWAEFGKPVGTFRNEDLWYFVDLIRNAES